MNWLKKIYNKLKKPTKWIELKVPENPISKFRNKRKEKSKEEE